MHDAMLRLTLGVARFPPFYDDTPFGIYQKILAGRIDFPKCVTQR